MANVMSDFVHLYGLICDDKGVRQALMDSPEAVLAKHHLVLPDGVQFLSVDDCMHAPKCIHITVKGAGSLCVRADKASEF